MYLQATTSHVWSPVGQTPIVRVDPGRTNTHFYGTLNLQTGEEIAMQSEEMNSEASARHLEMVLDANPDVPILLFWDRAEGKPLIKSSRRTLVWKLCVSRQVVRN